MSDTALRDFSHKCAVRVIGLMDKLSLSITEITSLAQVAGASVLCAEHRTHITYHLSDTFVQAGAGQYDSRNDQHAKAQQWEPAA